MSKEYVSVMEKLIRQCRQAYDARKPLILVDTEDVALMDQLARDSKLVDLLEPQEKDYDGKHVKYYRLVGDFPNALARAGNFTYSAEDLKDVVESSGSLSSGVSAKMLVAHLRKDDKTTVQYLRNYVHSYVRCRHDSALRSSCVLLYGDPGLLPPDLLHYTEILTVDYPGRKEIREILRQIAEENGYCEENGNAVDEKVINEVSEIMVGFSLPQVKEYARRLLWVKGENDKPILFSGKRKTVLLDAKAQAIRSTGGLLTLYREKDEGEENKENQETEENEEYEESKEKEENSLGGMRAYKVWSRKAGRHMKNNNGYARDRGVPAMKGVLLCGVPGCGKSEAAKILHRQWGIAMLRLDVDQLMGGLVGDSERNMRQALALAEAMSPCILWIDEIEKGFGGASSDQGDGGTFKRMFGRLLTWMQENRKPCFIFATANDISRLPPEFFRSGRFDNLFSVYMPTNWECKEIFAEQMRRADRLRKDTAKEAGEKAPAPLFEENCFEDTFLQSIMDMLMQGKDPENPENIKFLSGADIEKAVINALKKIPADKLGKPIDKAAWKEALGAVLQDPLFITQGSGRAGMDKIAACYVRLMRENFASVSAQSQQLFQKEFYQCEDTDMGVKVTYTGTCPSDAPYDRALFHALKGRIEKIAGKIEMYALERTCQ